MIRVRALENFWFAKFDEIKNMTRATSQDEYKHIIRDDTFDCSKEIAEYLLNKSENPVKRALVEVIEVNQDEPKEENKPVKPLKKNNISKKVAKK